METMEIDIVEAAYKQMAKDEQREAEALEWAEAVVEDAYHTDV